MAYSDYGAFVYLNGKERQDKEDVGVYDTDEADLPSGLRIFANIMKNNKNKYTEWWQHSQHGVMGDGAVRVACYKQGFPTIYYWKKGDDKPLELRSDAIIRKLGLEKEKYVWHDEDDDEYSFDFAYPEIHFEYEGYNFTFISSTYTQSRHYHAEMGCPNGDSWYCNYDYGFGAGF